MILPTALQFGNKWGHIHMDQIQDGIHLELVLLELLVTSSNFLTPSQNLPAFNKTGFFNINNHPSHTQNYIPLVIRCKCQNLLFSH